MHTESRILYTETSRVETPSTTYLRIRGLYAVTATKEIHIPDDSFFDLNPIILLASGAPLNLNVVKLDQYQRGAFYAIPDIGFEITENR